MAQYRTAAVQLSGSGVGNIQTGGTKAAQEVQKVLNDLGGELVSAVPFSHGNDNAVLLIVRTG